MIPRHQFINKIRDLGYVYKDRQKRTELWRRSGSTHRISISLNSQLEDGYVANVLRQCGCNEEEIKRFIAVAKS